MNKKIRLSRKTLKIILAVCLTAAVAITTGFFIYIYVVDKNTLGREIRIYQQEVSGLTVDEAQKKIMDAFNSRELTFYEDGKEVYRTSMKELGYSLDENVLNAQLTAIKQERDDHSAAGEFPYRVSDTEGSGKGKSSAFCFSL